MFALASFPGRIHTFQLLITSSMQEQRGRSTGTIYHVSSVNVYLGRQRGLPAKRALLSPFIAVLIQVLGSCRAFVKIH